MQKARAGAPLFQGRVWGTEDDGQTGCRNARAAEQDDGATSAGYDTSSCHAQGCGGTRCIEPRRGLGAGRVLTPRAAVRSASVLVILEPRPHFRSLRSAWTRCACRDGRISRRGALAKWPQFLLRSPLPPPRDQYWAHSPARVHRIRCRRPRLHPQCEHKHLRRSEGRCSVVGRATEIRGSRALRALRLDARSLHETTLGSTPLETTLTRSSKAKTKRTRHSESSR
jgi:hypothetical protein